MKRIIYLLLPLLGVSCDAVDDIFNIGTAEYGSPHVKFELKANVVDEQGNPIQGIEVRIGREGDDEWFERFDNNTGISDYLGNIDARGSLVFHNPKKSQAQFIDFDGELNGGEFETKYVDMSDLAELVEEGDGNWYNGGYRANVGQVVMHLSETQPDDENTESDENTETGNN